MLSVVASFLLGLTLPLYSQEELELRKVKFSSWREGLLLPWNFKSEKRGQCVHPCFYSLRFLKNGGKLPERREEVEEEPKQEAMKENEDVSEKKEALSSSKHSFLHLSEDDIVKREEFVKKEEFRGIVYDDTRPLVWKTPLLKKKPLFSLEKPIQLEILWYAPFLQLGGFSEESTNVVLSVYSNLTHLKLVNHGHIQKNAQKSFPNELMGLFIPKKEVREEGKVIVCHLNAKACTKKELGIATRGNFFIARTVSCSLYSDSFFFWEFMLENYEKKDVRDG